MKIKTHQNIKWKNLVGKTVKIGMSISQTEDVIVGKITKTRNIEKEPFLELTMGEERKIWVSTKYIVYILAVKD